MKLENESIFFKSTHCDKPFSKASQLDHDALDSERLMIETDENHDQISSDLNGDINLDNHLQCTSKDENGWNSFKEESSSIDSSDIDDVKALNVESFENDSELYAEKNGPECDLPKLIVCFEESSCNIVKDICIGERINPCSSPVKVVFESDENEDDQNDALMTELQLNDASMADELEISDGSLSEKDSIDRTELNESIPAMVAECDENYSNTLPNSEIEPCNHNESDPIKHSAGMSAKIESDSNPSTISACEHDNVTNHSSSVAKAEEHSLRFNEIIILESDKSSQIQHGIGESSFSSAAPLASLINYSGPIAYSGNLSIRSDSSTTSTRSFAFPILQTEWHHNSPVRMAEADRRRFFRKHKGWRQGLFCCRF